MIRKYRKLPVVIEAIQFEGTNFEEIEKWMESSESDRKATLSGLERLFITTLEGVMEAPKGHFIIKGVAGDGTDGTGLQHAIVVSGANIDAGLKLDTGYLRVGTGGAPDLALGAADNAYIEGTLEVDGNTRLDGNIHFRKRRLFKTKPHG